ncbi:hypothetical protein LG274_12065 [Micrococcus antarcticus]|uniref:hypothetical protein n=1 Tax=Micrococcus antarcticus TaxID=86171 RepID=UPI00384CC6A5
MTDTKFEADRALLIAMGPAMVASEDIEPEVREQLRGLAAQSLNARELGDMDKVGYPLMAVQRAAQFEPDESLREKLLDAHTKLLENLSK